MVGTFDVQNLGDLLFPSLARDALEARLGPIDLECFSYRPMGAGAWPFPVRAIATLAAELPGCDLLVVGGGDLIRGDEAIAPGYLPTDPWTLHPYGSWLGPSLLGLALGVPVVWSALGVGTPPDDRVAPVVDAAASGAGLVAVRDRHSAQALGRLAPGADIRVVPDTAFGLVPPTPEALVEVRSRLLGIDGGYVVVQPSAGMAAHADRVLALAAEAADLGLRVVELPIGPVLGDRNGRLPIAGSIRLDPWPSPLDAVAVLAGAEAVLADSLHAATIALVAGVPVFRPVSRTTPKYEVLEGFAAVHGLDEGLAGRVGRRAVEAGVVAAKAQLEVHWDDVAALVGTRRPVPPALLRLVQQLPARVAPTTDPDAQEVALERRLAAEYAAGYAAYRARAQALEDELDRVRRRAAELDLVEQRAWSRLGERLRPVLSVAASVRRRWRGPASGAPPGAAG